MNYSYDAFPLADAYPCIVFFFIFIPSQLVAIEYNSFVHLTLAFNT